jgi:hypothetical protein
VTVSEPSPGLAHRVLLPPGPCREGENRLVGRYLNPSAPAITRPWVALIDDATRIDGEHSGGRIDFRR